MTRRDVLPILPLILICVQQFCRAGANRLLDQYFVVYLQQARNLPIAGANLTASVPLWGAVFGSLLGGWLSDWVLTRTGSRRAARQGVAAASLAAAIVLYLLAGAASDLRIAVSAISLAFFISTFASPCAYSLILDMGGRNTAVVFGAMNMLGNLGAWACLWYGGRLQAQTHSWDPVLTFYLALHIVALASWLLINPSGVIGDKRSSAA